MAPATSIGVNKPVDVEKKDEDVSRKLQLYGILAAFRIGKAPSNDQIDIALNSLLASRPLTSPSERLSGEGRVLVADLRDFIKKAQHLFLAKNDGNLLQDFVWQTTQFDRALIDGPSAPVDKATAKTHGNRALEGLRTLGTLLITNGQFRKLLNDAIILLKDVTGDAAIKTAAAVKPSRDELAQIDHPAEDNTWHDVPDLTRENVKKQLMDAKANIANSGSPIVATTHASPPAGAEAPQQVLRPDQQAEPLVAEASEVREAAKAKEAEHRSRIKEYLSQKMPGDRRKQTVWRLKKLVIECQQHPDYQRAIQTLLDLAEEYGAHAGSIGRDASDAVKDARSGLIQAEADLKILMERFANGTSTDELWASISRLYRDANSDPELKDWLKAMSSYLRRCLEEQGYILDEASTDHWNSLYDRGSEFMHGKYKAPCDHIFDEMKFLIDQFDCDPQNRAVAASLKKLFADLGNDEHGRPKFKKSLVKDLTEVIFPAVFENVAYIPIPRVEYKDDGVDLVVENLVLESDNFMPNVLEISSENYVRWGRKTVTSKDKHSIEIKVAGVQMDMRDVSYHIRRKQGFPTLSDTGLADIFMGGHGLTFKIKISTPDNEDVQKFFKVDKVDVDVKHLKIKLSRSNHKLLFNLAKPLMLKVLRPVLQKAVEETILDQFTGLDHLLYSVKLEADRAVEETQRDPSDTPNIYRRYVAAAQRQILQGRRKVEKRVAGKRVNYAVTKDDSIFPEIHLPGGISSKATEYRGLATKGEKWESPVFSIGSAPKSDDLPRPPQSRKRQHFVNGGEVVGVVSD